MEVLDSRSVFLFPLSTMTASEKEVAELKEKIEALEQFDFIETEGF